MESPESWLTRETTLDAVSWCCRVSPPSMLLRLISSRMAGLAVLEHLTTKDLLRFISRRQWGLA